MKCKKCGTENNVGSKFCIGCGSPLEGAKAAAPEKKTVAIEPQAMPVNNAPGEVPKANNDANVSIMALFMVIIATITKPITTLKKDASKFDSFKNSAIVAGVLTVVATIITLITTMIDSVFVRYRDYFNGGYKTEIVFENLAEVEYFKIIGQNILIYLGAMAGIAFVFFIVALIMKKEVKYPRLLGITAVSLVPYIICSVLISPIVSMIYSPLGMIVTLIGLVYSLIILCEAVNNEVALEGDKKGYFNLICFGVIIVIIYIIYINVFVSSISSSLEDAFSSLGF